MNYYKALEDALELVRCARVNCAGGPEQPRNFLFGVGAYLQKRLTAEFETTWQEMRADGTEAN